MLFHFPLHMVFRKWKHTRALIQWCYSSLLTVQSFFAGSTDKFMRVFSGALKKTALLIKYLPEMGLGEK